MKFTAALLFLACSSYAFPAPPSAVPDKVPGRADSVYSGKPQEPRNQLLIKTSTRTPISRKAPEKKTSKTQQMRTSNDRSKTSSKKAAAKSPKKPSQKKKPSYLASLAHRIVKNKSPFSDSSIVREETRASTEDWESEATIVESETKASKEAYIWIPTFSTDKKIHYHRVRLCTDVLVVGLALGVIALILVIELWKPVAARYRRLRSGHGPINLDDIEVTNREDWGKKSPLSCEPMLQARLEGN
ncbi:hypothetical protein F4808DRAFT_97863 [Astrocystis sublimbata]|nr:hypothetical protein F4808DRAFT_97863 [Astrocystis sublimbata]